VELTCRKTRKIFVNDGLAKSPKNLQQNYGGPLRAWGSATMNTRAFRPNVRGFGKGRGGGGTSQPLDLKWKSGLACGGKLLRRGDKFKGMAKRNGKRGISSFHQV